MIPKKENSQSERLQNTKNEAVHLLSIFSGDKKSPLADEIQRGNQKLFLQSSKW